MGRRGQGKRRKNYIIVYIIRGLSNIYAPLPRRHFRLRSAGRKIKSICLSHLLYDIGIYFSYVAPSVIAGKVIVK